MLDNTPVSHLLRQALAATPDASFVASSKSGKIAAFAVKEGCSRTASRLALPHAEGWLFCVEADGDDVMMVDLSRAPDTPLVSANILGFFLARDGLNEAAESLEAAPSDSLSLQSGVRVADDTIRRLAFLLRPDIVAHDMRQTLFVDHLLRAFAVHVALAYGNVVPGSQQNRGGLATWQLRKAQELLRTNMDGAIALEHVAQACRLSVSHFSRAFRKSTGHAPYTWLRKHRIETAKSMLRAPSGSLSDIAVACGFSDQSHFTRVFHQEVGASPGAWRKSVAQAA